MVRTCLPLSSADPTPYFVHKYSISQRLWSEIHRKSLVNVQTGRQFVFEIVYFHRRFDLAVYHLAQEA